MLSSGEAGLYALTKVAAQILGLISMAADFGKATSAKVHTDSTAALGMVFRFGLGRTRHVRVQYFWTQQKVQDKEFVVEKVDTKENVADLMTKSLSAEVATYFMEKLGLCRADGRSNLTLEIALLTSGEAILRTAQFLKRYLSVWR